ncbi:MAG: serine/threonine-protein kinase [Sporichthyaceae bacterium]
MTTDPGGGQDGACPRALGEYVLKEQIGAGAMGEVFRARDAHGTLLAVKVLRKRWSDDRAMIERFRLEYRIASSVNDSHVVRAHAFIEAGSTYAIALDLVEGGTLDDAVRPVGTLVPAEVARIGAAVAQGLAAIHEAGYVHRDLKPRNILLTSGAGLGDPRLTDFGVAREHHLRHATQLVGTQGYVAPEVAEGSTPKPPCDIYALGSILYELLCGVTPHQAETPAASMRRMAEFEVGRPPGVPDRLWVVVHDCLRSDPDARPRARQVHDRLVELVVVLGGDAAAPRLAQPPEGPRRQLRARSRPHRRIALLAAGLMLVPVISGGWFWMSSSGDTKSSVPAGASMGPSDPTPMLGPDLKSWIAEPGIVGPVVVTETAMTQMIPTQLVRDGAGGCEGTYIVPGRPSSDVVAVVGSGGGTVERVLVQTTDVRTGAGIGVGSTLQALRTAHPGVVATGERGVLVQYRLDGPRGVLLFDIAEETVVQMVVAAPGQGRTPTSFEWC